MKSLSDIGKKKLADRAFAELKEIFSNENENLLDYGPERNDIEGTVTVDGHEFVFSENALRMKGFCPSCAQEELSVPIKSLADIADLIQTFRVKKDHRHIEP